MTILAHRGYWREDNNPNTLAAFEQAFRHGWGIETDVRDYCGQLVISHGVPDGKCPPFSEVLDIRDNYESGGSIQPLERPLTDRHLPIAINIKADGLQDMLAAYRDRIAGDFVFDMSVPELVAYKERGLPFFTRLSDVEKVPVCIDEASGVWMDGFYTEWIDAAAVQDALDEVERAGIISSEIHGRQHDALWQSLRKIKDSNFLLCTDTPDEAEAYFA